jgi:hypothetical protein
MTPPGHEIRNCGTEVDRSTKSNHDLLATDQELGTGYSRNKHPETRRGEAHGKPFITSLLVLVPVARPIPDMRHDDGEDIGGNPNGRKPPKSDVDGNGTTRQATATQDRKHETRPHHLDEHGDHYYDTE